MLLFANVATPEAHYTSIGSASGITLDSHFERAPTSTYAIGETYDYDLSANSKRRATLNWSWEASQHSTPTDSDTLVLPSYGLLNGRLEYSAFTHWTVAAIGTNLTNKVYYIGGGDYSVNMGSSYYNIGRPREWGISVRYVY